MRTGDSSSPWWRRLIVGAVVALSATASWTTTYNLSATEKPTDYVAAVRARTAADQQPVLLTR